MSRWLYVCSDLGISLDGSKGASEHVRAITRALARTGREVLVLAARGQLPTGHPARQVSTDFGEKARSLGATLRPWLASAGIGAAMGGEIAQITYEAELLRALSSDGFVPSVDCVVERLSLFGSAARTFARNRGVPYIVEMNAPLAQEAARYREAALGRLALEVERQAIQAADLVMTVSEPLRQHVIGAHHVVPDRVATVPNGVEVDLFSRPRDSAAIRRRLGLPIDALVIGFVGSLKAWHGVDTLIDAFGRARSRLPGARLLIVGEGRLADKFRRRAFDLNMGDDVVFHGAVPHEEVPTVLAAMDVAVAPYLPQDTFYFSPLKLFEYMAAGRCVVASRAGQISDTITHGRNGFLFTPGSAEELAAALVTAGNDGSLRRRLGAEARRDVAERDWLRVAERIASMVDRIQPREATHAA